MLFAALLISYTGYAQHSIHITLKDAHTSEALIGATVRIPKLNRASSTDTLGSLTFQNIPQGVHVLHYQYIGYKAKQDTIHIAADTLMHHLVLLQADDELELDEVIVSTTRSSRTISKIPTRIEVIAGEELDEKGNMKPGDIRMVLNESTGIQTQQTSPTSANASIRIQGLDGRYTQILKDGFPLFSGASAGLGLLQTPPLDLKQVEVIKGSASTLYGGGAIAGLVNLISKTPSDQRQLNFHLNGTSAGGLDINGFYGEQFGKAGLTLFAARNTNRAYAPAATVFTAIPEFNRYTFNPKLFLTLNDKTSLNIGLNSTFETRTGGDIQYIREDIKPSSAFFEINKTARLSSQLSLSHKLRPNLTLAFKNSVNYLNREITIPGYQFDGTQYATFTEASLATQKGHAEWVYGLNLWTDQFNEKKPSGTALRDYRQTTLGAFIQNNISVNKWLELETGLRGDYVVDYGFALLPRLSGLVKITEKLSSRIGGGLGYKVPTIFTEETERIQYQNVFPVSSNLNKLERSYGGNWDINFSTPVNDKLTFSINHLFFYTLLNNPMILSSEAAGLRLKNLAGHMDSKGMETNLKLTYQDLKLFVGYSFTDAKIHSGAALFTNPLTAKHRLNNVLMYEVEDKWKLGAEAYYYSTQQLNDGRTGKSYWLFGFMAEKVWERLSLYINFENFTDTRQTRFDHIYTGTRANPNFLDIYAPLDGFVVNGGLKLKL